MRCSDAKEPDHVHAHNSLVLVADGRKALFLRNHGNEQQIDLRTEAHGEREDRKDSDIKTAPAGQSPAPAGTGLPGGTMGETDFHQQDEDRCARELADKVNAMALAGEFDALTIVAPARTWANCVRCGTRKRPRG